MEQLFISIPLAFLGFCTYEVALRIIDSDDAFITRVGPLRYWLYFVIFGAFSSLLGGSVGSLPSNMAALIFTSAVGGFAIPAGGRLLLAALVKWFFGQLSQAGGPSIGNNNQLTKGQRRRRITKQDSDVIDSPSNEELWKWDEGSAIPAWIEPVVQTMRIASVYRG